MGSPAAAPPISEAQPGASPSPRLVTRAVGLLTELTTVILVWRWLDSRLLWLALGLAPALWLDRQVFHLLPWPRPKPWREELLRRAFYFAVGVAFLFIVGWPA